MSTYRPVSEYGKAVYGVDDFDADFTAVEERDMVGNGHLEIVPRAYTVTSDNYADGQRGDVVELALPVETEAALIFGGHLEPVQELDDGSVEQLTEEDAEPDTVEEPAPTKEEEEV